MDFFILISNILINIECVYIFLCFQVLCPRPIALPSRKHQREINKPVQASRTLGKGCCSVCLSFLTNPTQVSRYDCCDKGWDSMPRFDLILIPRTSTVLALPCSCILSTYYVASVRYSYCPHIYLTCCIYSFICLMQKFTSFVE